MDIKNAIEKSKIFFNFMAKYIAPVSFIPGLLIVVFYSIEIKYPIYIGAGYSFLIYFTIYFSVLYALLFAVCVYYPSLTILRLLSLGYIKVLSLAYFYSSKPEKSLNNSKIYFLRLSVNKFFNNKSSDILLSLPGFFIISLVTWKKTILGIGIFISIFVFIVSVASNEFKSDKYSIITCIAISACVPVILLKFDKSLMNDVMRGLGIRKNGVKILFTKKIGASMNVLLDNNKVVKGDVLFMDGSGLDVLQIPIKFRGKIRNYRLYVPYEKVVILDKVKIPS